MQPSEFGLWSSPYQRDMTPVLMLVHLMQTSAKEKTHPAICVDLFRTSETSFDSWILPIS